MGRFDNQIVSVTGAGAGIGRATALAFAREGAVVIASDRDAKTGEATAAELRKAGSERSAFIGADVADTRAVIALFEAIRTRFGRLDIAVNNAGVEGAVVPIEEQTEDNFAQVIGVNLKGTFLCLREEVKLMKPQKSGVIINLASITAHLGFTGLSVYSASKHAILGMTKSVALECIGHGIRVASVSPGLVDTDMLARFVNHSEENKKAFEAGVPLGRSCTPAEIARSILYLASDDGALLVGQTLNLDGGWAFVKS